MTQKAQNSQNRPLEDKPSEALALAQALRALRGDIDAIDNQLLDLLAKRQGLSREIVTKKALGSNVFRPDREVSLLRNLVAAHPDIEARLIMGLWRHIISASIAEQKPDYMIAHHEAARDLAKAHGAGYMNLSCHETLAGAINALGEGAADCVIITEAQIDELADLLGPNQAGDVFIAASIPFLHDVMAQNNEVADSGRGYVLCRELPARSGDDVVVIRAGDGTLSHHALSHDDDGDDDSPSALPDGVIVGTYATPLSFQKD